MDIYEYMQKWNIKWPPGARYAAAWFVGEPDWASQTKEACGFIVFYTHKIHWSETQRAFDICDNRNQRAIQAVRYTGHHADPKYGFFDHNHGMGQGFDYRQLADLETYQRFLARRPGIGLAFARLVQQSRRVLLGAMSD